MLSLSRSKSSFVMEGGLLGRAAISLCGSSAAMWFCRASSVRFFLGCFA